MQYKVDEIKRITNEIEKSINNGNKIYLEKLLDEMICVCEKMRSDIQAKKNSFHGAKLEIINEIRFLYKPVLKKNYYEGTYLEEFSKKRTEDLKEAKALDTHNRFWQTYEIMRGNVFGSIPLELITKDGARRLMGYGWDEVMVRVLEVYERQCSVKELVEYCELNFNNFLIVKEKSTNAEMILHYQI
ncbi:hypothetical protein [Thermotalea metallivorans]|uniref:Uncharacterized protein n=1 Tax=Thermotalea metallivorans TaxID=520762 RepID=A0A140KZ66_9FIRM|nr:hypothetical protein [Thermotalea metallivorans]KXG73591.1 hypothetical protein AN619_30770 [Thermotalea metallivorans]